MFNVLFSGVSICLRSWVKILYLCSCTKDYGSIVGFFRQLDGVTVLLESVSLLGFFVFCLVSGPA